MSEPELSEPLLVTDVPSHLRRLRLYVSLQARMSRWGQRADDLTAFVDLSNHPTLAAQSTVRCAVRLSRGPA